MATQECPCGYLGDAAHSCVCDPMQVVRYRSRISGPLRDRMDLHVDVPAISFDDLNRSFAGESSQSIRARVGQARERQRARGQRGVGSEEWNAALGPGEIRKWCYPGAAGRRLLSNASDGMGLSARAIHRVLKVARTVADLEGENRVCESHIAEALQYRVIDRTLG